MNENTSMFRRNWKNEPLLIKRGEGVYLYDDKGNALLDGMSSAGVIGIGHGRTEIYDALAKAGDSVTYVYSAGFTHQWQEELSKSLLSVAPDSMDSVYFLSGGSEANETALKLSRQYFMERGMPQKQKALARWQSYHGVTIATLSLSGRTSWRSMYDPYLFDVNHIIPPYEYRCPYCADKGGCDNSCADELERAILLEGPETVAVFFAEPVIGTTASAIVPNPKYYRRIREICDKYDVLFVADEVLCGYGRTGKPFAIQHWEGCQPDMISMGKAIGSGYAPLAALVINEKITDVFKKNKAAFNHGFTYSGTPVSCFVGLKVFEIMQREDLFHKPAVKGAILKDKLEKLAQRHEMIGQVRGKGLLLGMEFVENRKTRKPFAKEAAVTSRISNALMDRGLIICPGVQDSNFGHGGDHIQISPPFIINDKEIDIIVDTLDDALTELEPQLRK